MQIYMHFSSGQIKSSLILSQRTYFIEYLLIKNMYFIFSPGQFLLKTATYDYYEMRYLSNFTLN